MSADCIFVTRTFLKIQKQT